MKERVRKTLRISVSALDQFNLCSMRYKWTVLDELQPDEASDNLYAVLGTAFHKAMQMHDLYEMTVNDLLGYWKGLFYAYASDCLYLPGDVVFQPFIERGRELLYKGLSLKERWKDSDILFTENYFRIPYPNRFIEDVSISGRIDLGLKSDGNVYTAIDWKTSKNMDKHPEKNNQATFYIYYIHKTFNIPLEDIFAGFAYPEHEEIVFTQRTQEDIDLLFKNIDGMLGRIMQGDFKKEPRLNFCPNDCYFCSYKKHCKRHDS